MAEERHNPTQARDGLLERCGTVSWTRWMLVALLSLTFVSACTPPARVTTYDGRQLRGTLVEGETAPGELVMETEDGSVERIPTSEVKDVTHPGTVAGAAGAGMFLIGAIVTVFGIDRFVDGNTDAVYIAAAGAVLVAVGGTTFGWSLTVWNASHNVEEEARKPVSGASSVPRDRPSALSGGGVKVRLRF